MTKANLHQLLLLSASCAVLAGCSAKPVTAAPEGGASGDTIKIGLNYELSGDVASYGQASVAGIKLASWPSTSRACRRRWSTRSPSSRRSAAA